MIRAFQREQFVPGDPAAIWDFFATPRNLDALTPPTVRFEIRSAVPARMYPGQMIRYRIGLLPGVTVAWLTEITQVREGELFVDEQRIGPYKLWHHEHHFRPVPGRRGLFMEDRVTYDPGWGWAGGIADALWIRRQLAAIFDYRARKVAELFPEPAERTAPR